MRVENLTKQVEELVFDIGRQVPHKDLHATALSVLKGLYALTRHDVRDERGGRTVADEELAQIQKAERKLRKWSDNQNLVPAVILMDYLHQSMAGAVDKTLLEEAFKIKSRGDAAMFSRNFDQMKNFSEKNHAKIFDVSPGGVITIWPPVEKYVRDFEKIVFKGKKQGFIHRSFGALVEE